MNATVGVFSVSAKRKRRPCMLSGAASPRASPHPWWVASRSIAHGREISLVRSMALWANEERFAAERERSSAASSTRLEVMHRYGSKGARGST